MGASVPPSAYKLPYIMHKLPNVPKQSEGSKQSSMWRRQEEENVKTSFYGNTTTIDFDFDCGGSGPSIM